MSNPTTGMSTPVGTVLAYAGQHNGDWLEGNGWLLCYGKSLPCSQYPELFAAIGTANGADDADHFRLPQLQGLFLRGLDPFGSVDKGPRVAPARGGNSGWQPASFEGYATAAPSGDDPFETSVRNLVATHNSYSGTNAAMLVAGSAQVLTSDSGGDLESRPPNAYVNFVIKCVSTASLLPGMVIAFAGNEPTDVLKESYAFCNGWAFARGQLTELYDALGTAHGTDGTNVNLPDYRGRFLRGVDNGIKHDPDSSGRTEMATAGATGDAVGSVQRHATGRPFNPFTVSIAQGNTEWVSDHAYGVDVAMWNPGSVAVDLTVGGGDGQTRPVNIAVDQYVVCVKEQEVDLFPIGGVMAFSSSKAAPPANQWFLCDGSSLSRTDPAVAALFAAIGTASGAADASHFNLPDYQGYFLRGKDHGAGHDSDAGGRTPAKPGGLSGDNVGSLQGFATGQPFTHITAQANHLPVVDAVNAAGWGPTEVPAWDEPSILPVAGGDAETRPINVAVNFYIKYASASG